MKKITVIGRLLPAEVYFHPHRWHCFTQLVLLFAFWSTASSYLQLFSSRHHFSNFFTRLPLQTASAGHQLLLLAAIFTSIISWIYFNCHFLPKCVFFTGKLKEWTLTLHGTWENPDRSQDSLSPASKRPEGTALTPQDLQEDEYDGKVQ